MKGLMYRRFFSQVDWILCGLLFSIPLCGLVVLYSAGFDPDAAGVRLSYLSVSLQSPTFLRQAFYLLLGASVFVICALIPTRFYHRGSYLLYGVGIGLLVAVLLFGTVVNGSRRWLDFGGFRLQPSELMKLIIILAVARFLSRHPPGAEGYSATQLFLPLIIAGVPMLLIQRQPDLGTALVVGFLAAAMTLFIGVRFKVVATTFLVVMLAIIPVWNLLQPYQQRRVMVLLNPDADPLGSGYHITQSKIAVGSGGLAGKGFLKGTQTQLEFLPEHTTDFIFSVLGEEWGFVGCLFVLGLYFSLIYRLLFISGRSQNLFVSLVIFGIATLWFSHVFVNIGMVVGLLPVVGIPLPLFSYGGSAMMTFCASVGIAVGMWMRRYQYVAGRD